MEGAEVVKETLPGQMAGDDKPGAELLISLDKAGVSFSQGKSLFGKKYWALDSVSLELRSGEVLGVLGGNGSGKSTLLKLLAGIVDPDSGSVYRKKGVKISLLALQLGFVPMLTGKENAIMSCILLGLSRRDAVSRLERIFAFAEIEDAIDKPVGAYSAGMKARLGFGIAMEANPDVLLIDEVLGVGDSHFRKKSSSYLKQRMLSGSAAVIVSHEINTLRRLCNRVVVIKDGRNYLSGDVDTVLAEYSADDLSKPGAPRKRNGS